MKRELTLQETIQLRNQIVLNSLYISDYRNDMGVSPDDACTFFDGFMSFLEDEAEQDGFTLSWSNWDEFFSKYDTAENLERWWYCFDTCPLYTEQDEEWQDEEDLSLAA